MPQTPTPFWNADFAGQEAAAVGYMELLPYSGSKAGTGPFRIDTAGNVTAQSVNAIVGLAASGDTTGATDPANIQAAFNLGARTVQLGQGDFYGNTAVIVPPYCALIGQPNSSQVSQTSKGTVWHITAGYTGTTITDNGAVTLKAAFIMYGQTFGGYSTASEEQHLRDIMINGSAAPSGVQGILSYGRVSRVQLERVLISQVTGDGLQQNNDASGNQPDAWYGYRVFSRFNGGKGFVLRSADSTWAMCVSSNNGDTGTDWFINTTSNSKYIGCRSEHSAGLGFGYVCTNAGNSSGGVYFIGCSTDQSALHGIQIGGTINSVASNAHATPVLLSGCIFRRDGQNGGTGGSYAGIYVHGYGATSGGLVTIAGCQVWPGVNDDGSGINAPKYGIWVDNASKVTASGSAFFSCATGDQSGALAVNDDASGGANTINYDNAVVTGTGSTGTMAVTMSPNVAAYQGKSLVLTPGSAPGTDPLLITSANSGERAFGMKVSGDSSDRVKWTSDGHLNLGPGNATQDWSLARSGAAAATITGALSVTGRVTAQLVAAPVRFNPANPSTTTSTTDIMAGFGSAGGGAVAFTPGSSGKVLVLISGEGNTATAAVTFNVGARYGTGTAPNAGDAVTGTRIGPGSDYQPRAAAASVQAEFSFNDVLSLTAGTTYWLDLAYSTSNASDAALIKNVVFSIVELS